jgi:hypothetical protein
MAALFRTVPERERSRKIFGCNRSLTKTFVFRCEELGKGSQNEMNFHFIHGKHGYDENDSLLKILTFGTFASFLL